MKFLFIIWFAAKISCKFATGAIPFEIIRCKNLTQKSNEREKERKKNKNREEDEREEKKIKTTILFRNVTKKCRNLAKEFNEIRNSSLTVEYRIVRYDCLTCPLLRFLRDQSGQLMANSFESRETEAKFKLTQLEITVGWIFVGLNVSLVMFAGYR